MDERENGACGEGDKARDSRDEHEQGDEAVEVGVQGAGLLGELCHAELVQGVLDDVGDQREERDHRHGRSPDVRDEQTVQNLKELLGNVEHRLQKNNKNKALKRH